MELNQWCVVFISRKDAKMQIFVFQLVSFINFARRIDNDMNVYSSHSPQQPRYRKRDVFQKKQEPDELVIFGKIRLQTLAYAQVHDPERGEEK